MQRYVAFLSGLPVGRGGVGMDTLRGLFSRLGFLDVETYLSTGNVAFNTAPVGLTGPLEAQISRHLKRSLELDDFWTFIRTPRELSEVVDRVPFTADEMSAPGNSLFVVLLSEEPDERTVRRLRIRRNDVDDLRLSGREIYWLRRAHDETVAPPSLSEILDAPATVRSFTTIRHLVDMYAVPSKLKSRRDERGDSTESARSRQ